jgi:hypothetical protein
MYGVETGFFSSAVAGAEGVDMIWNKYYLEACTSQGSGMLQIRINETKLL